MNLHRFAGVIALSLAVTVLSPVAYARADDSTSTTTASLEEEGKLRQHWQGLYRSSQVRERRAELQLEKAQGVWTRGRRNNRLRGEPRVKAEKDLESARLELQAAKAAHKDLLEQARRDGVPPGWFRDVESEG